MTSLPILLTFSVDCAFVMNHIYLLRNRNRLFFSTINVKSLGVVLKTFLVVAHLFWFPSYAINTSQKQPQMKMFDRFRRQQQGDPEGEQSVEGDVSMFRNALKTIKFIEFPSYRP